jgi:hypothetical protein
MKQNLTCRLLFMSVWAWQSEFLCGFTGAYVLCKRILLCINSNHRALSHTRTQTHTNLIPACRATTPFYCICVLARQNYWAFSDEKKMQQNSQLIEDSASISVWRTFCLYFCLINVQSFCRHCRSRWYGALAGEYEAITLSCAPKCIHQFKLTCLSDLRYFSDYFIPSLMRFSCGGRAWHW